MFKSSISSYLFPQWFRKSTPSTPTNTNTNTKSTTVDAPKNFTIANQDNKLINVSMDNEVDEFVDIQTKQLSYAEVASLGKNKSQSVKSHQMATAKPSTTKRIEKNQFDILKLEEEAIEENRDSLDGGENFSYEPFKSGDEYDRSMNYKSKQSKAIIKKKKFNRELKNKQKS